MHLKKIFALALAALMLLSLWACGKQNGEYQSGIDAADPDAQLMPDEAGKLTIYGGADLQLVYNAAGNVIAVTALNTPAKDIAANYDFAEKSCSLAAMELIDLLFDQNLTISRAFVLIRQEPGSATPSDDFLKNLQEDAQLNRGQCAVIVVAADELDQDGLFSKDTALNALKISYPALEGAILECSDVPVGGTYTITHTDAEGNTTQYGVGALDGVVIQFEISEEAGSEAVTDDETIPENDIFDPIPDTEAIAGTDGGVDNGSIDFN